MRITITGGSGFIGTQLANFLIKKGHKITIADIKEPKGDLRKFYKFCDVTDPFQVKDIVDQAKLVFHLAANPNPGLAERNPRWDLRINVYGTMNILNACMRNNSRMIFTSSAAVKYSPYSCYAISKRTAEKYILHYVEKSNLDAVITRFWNVYGPTQGLGYVIPDFIDKLSKNPDRIEIRGTGFDMRDFVYIDDVIRALWVVADKGKSGTIYEVGTNTQVTIRELAQLIGKLMNKKIPEVVPSRSIKVWSRKEIKEDLEPLKSLGWVPRVGLDEGILKVLRSRK